MMNNSMNAPNANDPKIVGNQAIVGTYNQIHNTEMSTIPD